MHRLYLNIEINQNAIFEAIDRVEQFLQAHTPKPQIGFNVRLALEELLLNLVDHTDMLESDLANLDISIDEAKVNLVVRDSAPAFDHCRMNNQT